MGVWDKVSTALTYATLIFVAVILFLHFVLGFQYVVILTDSMEPYIHPGDLVITRPVDPGKLRPGDVILYEVKIGNSTYRITHRITAVKADETGGYYFLTKGDNRKYTDPWRVYSEQVIGKVIFIIPGLGRLWYYAPLIILILFLLIIAGLAYDLAIELLEENVYPSKARRPEYIVLKRKKLVVHHYRKRKGL